MVTLDKDMGQMLNENIVMYDAFKDQVDEALGEGVAEQMRIEREELDAE